MSGLLKAGLLPSRGQVFHQLQMGTLHRHLSRYYLRQANLGSAVEPAGVQFYIAIAPLYLGLHFFLAPPVCETFPFSHASASYSPQ